MVGKIDHENRSKLVRKSVNYISQENRKKIGLENCLEISTRKIGKSIFKIRKNQSTKQVKKSSNINRQKSIKTNLKKIGQETVKIISQKIGQKNRS